MAHIVERRIQVEFLLADERVRLLLRLQQAVPFRDILVCGHPAAAGHRTAHDLDRSSIGKLRYQRGGLPLRNRGFKGGAVLFHIAEEGSGVLAMTNKITEVRS